MKWFEIYPELLRRDKQYIINNHPNLHFKEIDKSISIIGKLGYKKEIIKNIELSDEYFLRIDYSENHPVLCPKVHEIESKIENTFHMFENGALCLEAPNKIYEIFGKQESIQNFIENLVIPFLYSYTYFKKFGKIPWNDWDHNGDGLYQYYSNVFKNANLNIIINLLKYYLSKNKYIGSIKCPCKSKKSFGECHKKILKSKLWAPPEILKSDLKFLKKLLEKNPYWLTR